jgi:hypothetical protein
MSLQFLHAPSGYIAFAIETIDQERIGLIVFLKLLLLLICELPVATNVAVTDQDLTKLVCPIFSLSFPALIS